MLNSKLSLVHLSSDKVNKSIALSQPLGGEPPWKLNCSPSSWASQLLAAGAAESWSSSQDWHTRFADPVYRGRHFYQLKGVGGKLVLPSTHKGGPWLKVMGNSTTDTSHATHMITGHAPIGEYRHCFSLDGEYQCWCHGPEIQTRDHILCVCPSVDCKETRASPDTVEGFHEFFDNKVWVVGMPPLASPFTR
ncbi:hypothetical protein L208DRAFT_1533447 [Tricholoma matsutake]|nr:hypothetical protein L208DRAFT_1533447 [Tricholoma matsutake 945]